MSRNFVHFPGTRLGKLARAKTTKDINAHCDKFFPGDIPEYFFDHNWMGFNSILDVYRIGTLHLMSGKSNLYFFDVFVKNIWRTTVAYFFLVSYPKAKAGERSRTALLDI